MEAGNRTNQGCSRAEFICDGCALESYGAYLEASDAADRIGKLAERL